MIKICIAIPSARFWEASFGECLAAQTASFMAWDIGREKTLCIRNAQTSILPDGRSRLVKEALEADATHILWLDSDMKFPCDSLQRLLDHDKDIVGCNYVRKSLPAHPTTIALDGSRLHTTRGKTGIEMVRHLGFGVLLTKIEVFKALEQPWFFFGWNSPRSCYVGEDVIFCDRARKAGFQVFVDHDLSKEVAHIGSFDYSNDLSDLGGV